MKQSTDDRPDGHASRMTEYLVYRTNQLQSYHNHKETMAHAGFLVLLALLAGLLSQDTWPPAWVPKIILSSKQLALTAVLLLACLIHVYIRWQLQRRRFAALFVKCALSTLRKWANSPPCGDQLKPYKGELWTVSNFHKFLDHIIPWKKARVPFDEGIENYPNDFANEFKNSDTGAMFGEWLVSVGSLLLIAIMLLFLTSAVHAQTSDTFTWITEEENPQLYSEIRSVFKDELQPDIPERVKPIVPDFYKYISKIGSFQNTYIVLIGYRERETEPKEYDYFRAFSYDTAKQTKREIQPKDVYYQWSLLTQALFEPSVTPDIVFKYFDCLECEKVELLSSFMFDHKEKTWKRRIWPDNDPDLLIGSDTQYGDDFWVYDCLYKIGDFNSDNFADIAIRCRVTGETTRKITDELLLYTIQKGIAKKIQIRDKKKVDQISNVLCEGQDSPLCKSK